MTTVSPQKEILDMVARLPKSKQAMFWETIKKELAAIAVKELDSRTRKIIPMQEIVQEVREVRKAKAKNAPKSNSGR